MIKHVLADSAVPQKVHFPFALQDRLYNGHRILRRLRHALTPHFQKRQAEDQHSSTSHSELLHNPKSTNMLCLPE